MNPAVRWLRGLAFDEIEGTCHWIARRAGSCGLRPPANAAPARRCAERTDYRMSEAEVRQTIPYRPMSSNSGKN